MKKYDLMKDNSSEVADVLKTLAHPQRLMLLCLLLEAPKSVNEIAEILSISQSQTSQFLNRMSKEGLISHDKKSNFSYYKIKDKRLLKLIKSLKSIYC